MIDMEAVITDSLGLGFHQNLEGYDGMQSASRVVGSRQVTRRLTKMIMADSISLQGTFPAVYTSYPAGMSDVSTKQRVQ